MKKNIIKSLRGTFVTIFLTAFYLAVPFSLIVCWSKLRLRIVSMNFVTDLSLKRLLMDRYFGLIEANLWELEILFKIT